MKEIDMKIYKKIHCSQTKVDLKTWVPNEWNYDLQWATARALLK